MGMVASEPRIASAFFVGHGRHGDVSRYARQRGVCRQWVYREAARVQAALAQVPAAVAQLRATVRQLRAQLAASERRLRQAVVLDADKQAAVAVVGQARGVSLRTCRALLDVLLPGQVLSRATLGRRTRVAAEKAGRLLAVLDEMARPLAREAAADEIYVKAPVLMVVEPESLCWLSGRLSPTVDGPAWQQELAALPNLQQVTRDGGAGLAKGVALENAQRAERQDDVLVDQGDHFHALRGGGVGLRKAELQAQQALAAVEAAEKELVTYNRQGRNKSAPAVRLHHALQKTERALEQWQEQQRLWQQTKEALLLFTPTGELNTRTRAAAVLAETLPQLPDSGFAKAKRQLHKPEMLSYLERVQQQFAALPVAEEVKQAALRQEGLRRRPEALAGESPAAAARRGILLVCAVVLSKAGAEGQQALAAIRDLLRRACRASSLVECINSVLRMQQASQRKMTQGLLDLKRLYWNCHTFESGRRRQTTPYQRLGVPWPDGLSWGDMVKLTPEQLREKLSTARKVA
jgi:hypothetical protein